MRLAILAVILVMGGCASLYPQRYRYYKCGIRVVVASADQVDAHCRKIVTTMDDGMSARDYTGKFRACIGKKVRGLRTVFMIEGKERSLLHELCHNDGAPKEVCAEIH